MSEIDNLTNEVALFIKSERDKYFPRSVLLGEAEQFRFRLFFPTEVLKNTRFCFLQNERTGNPPFLKMLIERGFQYPNLWETYGTTYLDVVVHRVPLSEPLVFHELVHVIQYRELGLKAFSEKYVKGLIENGEYMNIPLEVNAYKLQEAFEKEPRNGFSVEEEVRGWIRDKRF